ncbi:MAG: hypothetical protein V1858_03640 [Candidatus Gottesmanbacteria bacterium]
MKSLTLPISISSITVKYLTLVLSFFSFTIPFLLGHPQIMVGTLVNAALFTSAILFPKKYFWPIIILPSLAVLSRGIIFGPMTFFLVYFLPFIWLGNLGLIWIFKKTFKDIGFFGAVIFSALGKQILLYTTATVFLNFKLVPKVFLITMGIDQFITALAGGFITYFIFRKYFYGTKL